MSYPIERLQNLRDALTAELEGRPWEVYPRLNQGVKEWESPTVGIEYYLANFNLYFLRPRRAPKVTPWTLETCPPLPHEILWDGCGSRTFIAMAGKSLVWIGAASVGISWEELLKSAIQRDGSPCGVVEP